MKKIVKQLFLYFFLFVIIKSILSYFIQAPSAFSDSYHYMKLARNFFYSLEFSVHGNPLYRFPLYPIVLSISYLFKDMIYIYPVIKVINAIISSLIIFPAFLLSREFLSEKKALTSAILISLIPSNFSFTPFIMAENLLYPLFLFIIYFIYKSFNKNYKYIILVILFFILLSFTKFLPKEFIYVFTNFLNPYFYLEIFFYLSYIILATGILFSITSIFFFKNMFKNKKYLIFGLIVLFSVISMIIICANHSTGIGLIFDWGRDRPIGRYIEIILPLIFITGFIGINNYDKKLFKKIIIIFVPILIFASLLATYPLFPVNNMSLTWIGILSYLLPIYFLSILFLLILALIYLFRNKLTKLIPLFILFFLSVSLLNYAVIYYNVEKFWYNGEQMQLGLWLNKYDKGKSLIIFDERDCIRDIFKDDQYSICENGKTFTAIGVWLNNDIRIEDISNPPKNSIIISRHILNLQKIKETESGILVYKNI